MGQLDGKVAIITGGGSGIGKGIARAFAREGCRVILAARNVERLNGSAAEIRAECGPLVEAYQLDVTQEEQVLALFQDVMARYGRLDILVNNAAAFDWGRSDELSLAAWRRVMDTGVTGAFLCSREAFKIMKAQGGGRNVNIGSIAAQRPRESSAPYTTSKHAILGPHPGDGARRQGVWDHGELPASRQCGRRAAHRQAGAVGQR